MQLITFSLLLIFGIIFAATGLSASGSTTRHKIRELLDSSLKTKQAVAFNGESGCIQRCQCAGVDKSTEGIRTKITSFDFDKACSESKAAAIEKTSFLTSRQKRWIKRLGEKVRPLTNEKLGKKPVTRKEIRQYSDSEWKDVVTALNRMKSTKIDGLSQFAIISNLHEYEYSVGWLSQYGVVGPGIWGWHREYLARLEKAMQTHVAGVSLPYWDISLDAYLPLSSSVIWSDGLLGNCGSSSTERAAVTTGSFKDWPVEEPYAQAGKSIGLYHSRSCSATKLQSIASGVPLRNLSFTNIFNDLELKHVLGYSTFADFATDLCLLEDHYAMKLAICATSSLASIVNSCTLGNPEMIFMHVYLDYIWEQFRQKSQTTDLEKEYMSSDNGDLSCQGFDQPMEPFDNLKNSDGLDSLYTKLHYVYEESVDSCTSAASCGSSSYLWCDTETSRCKSKIRTGESCKFFSDEACESGVCGENHLCTSSSLTSPTESASPTTLNRKRTNN